MNWPKQPRKLLNISLCHHCHPQTFWLTGVPLYWRHTVFFITRHLTKHIFLWFPDFLQAHECKVLEHPNSCQWYLSLPQFFPCILIFSNTKAAQSSAKSASFTPEVVKCKMALRDVGWGEKTYIIARCKEGTSTEGCSFPGRPILHQSRLDSYLIPKFYNSQSHSNYIESER